MVDIIAETSALDSQMFGNFMQYSYNILDTWSGALEKCNNGQKTIIMEHLFPVAYEHVGEAANYWPAGAQPVDYAQALWGSYDADVLERAFADLIEEPMDNLHEWITEAAEWQDEHERLCNLIGDSWEPHSVYPPFEGGGGMMTQRTGAGKSRGF